MREQISHSETSAEAPGPRVVGSTRVGVAQIGADLGDVQANLGRILRAVESAGQAGVALLVLPECALSGYLFDDLESASRAAVGVGGPEVAVLDEACQRLGLFCVFGLLEAAGQRVYNTALLLGPQGPVGRYRKCHLPCLGVDRFTTPGDAEEPAVYDTSLGRVGLAICYDLRFPESARTLALTGADIIAQPSNWPNGAQLLADHFVRVRACENRVFMLVANRGDREQGVDFIGCSQIASPSGEILAMAPRGEALLVADIDVTDAREKRIVVDPGVYEVSLFRDRRPELYQAITAPAAGPLHGDRAGASGFDPHDSP